MIICIIQARMGSSRLPGKVLMNLAGKPMLEWVIEAVSKAQNIDQIKIATTLNPEDDFLAETYSAFRYFDANNVLARYYFCAKRAKADHIVRITGDCPLVIPGIIDSVIGLHLLGEYDFTHSERWAGGWPNGTGAEIMTMEALERAFNETKDPYDLEHVTPYFYNNPDRFKVGFFPAPRTWHEKYSIDTKEDFDRIERILKDKK